VKGRKPIPTALKILRGNPGRRPLNQNEPQVETASIEPPADLTGTALLEWKRLAPMLSTSGLLSVLDRDRLKLLCMAYQNLSIAHDHLITNGLIVKGPMGPEKSRIWEIVKDLNKEISGHLDAFGMSPSSRSRVAAVKTKTAPLDRQHEKYFGGSRG